MGEPVKLAAFLRDRCDAGHYGLQYINADKNLIAIPWPVAPRPNESLAPAFEMFREWARLSFQKRNNEFSENEPPTTQKHRFRNALSRADGIVPRKDLASNNRRVYEFVESKKKVPQSQSSPLQPVPSVTAHSQNIGYTGEFNVVQGSPPGGAYPDVYPTTDNFMDTGNILEPAMARQEWPAPSEYSPNGNNWPGSPDSNQQNVDEVLDLIRPGDNTNFFDQIEVDDFPAQPEILPPPQQPQQPQRVPLGAPIPRAKDNSTLAISLSFRDEEAMRHFVANNEGCRVYYGPNIPDISQLVEPEHLDIITRSLRHDPGVLFGPGRWEQVKLPAADNFMRSPKQLEKTRSILQNMERGLLLYLDSNQAQYSNDVPDVYAVRLCQTRIFPCGQQQQQSQAANVQQTGQWLPRAPDARSLRRLECTKVFDGQLFSQEFNAAASRGQKSPSASFVLSLGQRTTDETLLVSLTVTVQRAYQMIQNRADENQEVFISGATSMDDEAHKLADKLKSSCTLSASDSDYSQPPPRVFLQS